MTYYHGTDTEKAAKSIIKYGYLDPEATNEKYAHIKSFSRPVNNRVYITRDISYAVIYSLGADVAGSNYFDTRVTDDSKRFCYLFTFKDNIINDRLIPDEDNIGELLNYFYTKTKGKYDLDSVIDKSWFKSFVRLAESKLTTVQLKNIKSNQCDYEYYIKVGKKLIPLLTDEMVNGLILVIDNLSHDGKLSYSKAYKFDKLMCSKLKKDSSNFFDLAEEITSVTELTDVKLSFSRFLSESFDFRN